MAKVTLLDKELKADSLVAQQTLEISQRTTPTWLVENWLPLGHKAEDVAPEGSFKTIWGCYLGVCIASGTSLLNHPVRQGPVLFVDEETPEASLLSHLDRFSQGLGYERQDLPLEVLSMKGFRFGRKTELDKLLAY